MKPTRNADYSHPALGPVHMEAAIATLLRGLKNPMTQKQLHRWFYETPPRTINYALYKLVTRGTVEAIPTKSQYGRRIRGYTTPREAAK